MSVGLCKLCLKERDLQESHFMPRALYPTKKKIYFATRSAAGKDPNQVKKYLLCLGCETRFNQNGESDVLRWVGPKAKKGFPLLDKLRETPPRENSSDLTVHSASDLSVDTDKFAYFALSVVWRAAITQWLLPDQTITSILDLDTHEEPIRKFLIGEAPFPSDIFVILVVCTDHFSRERWMAPASGDDHRIYSFTTMGVIFRILVGNDTPERFRLSLCCCRASKERFVFSTDCKQETSEIFARLAPIP